MRTVTAAWSLSAIENAAYKADWETHGELSGNHLRGVRQVLKTVIRILPDKSGQGNITVAQIAARGGYSTRWVGECLRTLEDLGLITWRRGYLDQDGRGRPSWIRVSKKVFAGIVNALRAAKYGTVAIAERASERAARFKAMRARTRAGHETKNTSGLVGSMEVTSTSHSPNGDEVTRQGVTSLPIRYETGRFGRQWIINPNVCAFCTAPPHDPTPHHTFEEARTTPADAQQLGWLA